MILDYLDKLPNKIKIEDYRDYMPYKVCTGGSYLTYFTLVKLENGSKYQKIYGTTSPNQFNRATGKFRDKSIDDSIAENYTYLSSEEMKALVLDYINKNSKDIKLYIDDELFFANLG